MKTLKKFVKNLLGSPKEKLHIQIEDSCQQIESQKKLCQEHQAELDSLLAKQQELFDAVKQHLEAMPEYQQYRISFISALQKIAKNNSIKLKLNPSASDIEYVQKKISSCVEALPRVLLVGDVDDQVFDRIYEDLTTYDYSFLNAMRSPNAILLSSLLEELAIKTNHGSTQLSKTKKLIETIKNDLESEQKTLKAMEQDNAALLLRYDELQQKELISFDDNDEENPQLPDVMRRENSESDEESERASKNNVEKKERGVHEAEVAKKEVFFSMIYGDDDDFDNAQTSNKLQEVTEKEVMAKIESLPHPSANATSVDVNVDVFTHTAESHHPTCYVHHNIEHLQTAEPTDQIFNEDFSQL